ncbi:MAG TPA: hypothetical protein VFP60_01395 [Pseudolabrys sp.]|nr:hypothetical protein [Pseudolabrys sp.]
MAEKPTPPDPAEGGRPRKRQAPTIELTATEVPSGEWKHSTEGSTETPREEQHTGAESLSDEQGRRDGRDDSRRGGISLAPYGLGALGGALFVAAVLFALWLSGLLPDRNQTSPDAASAALELRLSKVEAVLAKGPDIDPSLSERLSAADNSMKALGTALAALNRRTDEIAAASDRARERADASERAANELRKRMQELATTSSSGLSPADVDNVQRRITAIEQQLKNGAPDRPARLALVTALLRDATASGRPFTGELQEARSLGADEKSLMLLAPFAAAGLPTAAALAHELTALIPMMAKTGEVQSSAGGFLDRLQANAGSLVRIRPLDAQPGNDSAAVLARIESRLAQADIDGVIAELEKLDAKISAPARSWVEKAEARQAAIAAAQQLALNAAHALENP